jgi:hypothetical protein
MFCQIVEASRLHDIGEQGKNVSNVIDELLHQFELIVKPQALEVCTQRIRTQNCNLELSHAHIYDEESCDPPSKWWTPLISSFGSRKVFDGYSASTIHG